MSNYKEYRSHPPLKRTPANLAYIAKVKTYNADVKEHNNRERQRVAEHNQRVANSGSSSGGGGWFSGPPRADAAIGY